MEITFKKSGTKLEDLKLSEVFRFNQSYFMVVSGDVDRKQGGKTDIPVVSLRNGVVGFLCQDCRVLHYPHAELNI